MVTTTPEPGTRRLPHQSSFTLRAALLLAIALGLAGGYLDLVIIVFKKYFWNDLRNFGSGRDFPWSVPVGHAVLC